MANLHQHHKSRRQHQDEELVLSPHYTPKHGRASAKRAQSAPDSKWLPMPRDTTRTAELQDCRTALQRVSDSSAGGGAPSVLANNGDGLQRLQLQMLILGNISL